MTLYDVIIIGGGISGLYSAYQIKKLSPNTSILILEKNKTLGGRMDLYNFYGTNVNIGAGVGRKTKDAILIKLLNELNIKYKEYVNHVKYSKYINKDIDITKIIKLLQCKYTKKYSTYTFKQYAIDLLGEQIYKDFVIKIGFSDFENEDVSDVLNYYGFEDNVDGWVALSIDWSLLIKKISEKIGLNNIKLESEVESIFSDNYFMSRDAFSEKTELNNIKKSDGYSLLNINRNFTVRTLKKDYHSKKIIIATTIETVIKLLPNLRIYDQVHGQVFLRVYAKFSSPIPDLDSYTIVIGPLKKIVPINPKEGIYMIAYTDNKDALSLKEYTSNNLKNRQYFCKLVEKTLGLENSLTLVAIKSFYWNQGTHYYEPLKKPFKNRTEFINQAQNPMKHMLVVGEMIAKHQGWTLGALESVDSVLNLDWIHKPDLDLGLVKKKT
jgi:hypothetical protein